MGNFDKLFHIIFSIYPLIFCFTVTLVIYFFYKEIKSKK